MGVTHKFESIRIIAQLIRAYLLMDDCSDKPSISGASLKLVCSLIGREEGDTRWTWTISEARCRRRLKSAGIDPKTFAVIDERAAAFAWYQLRTTRKYKEAVQRQLMNSGENPPDINIPLVFADKKTNDEIKSQNIQTPQLKPFTTLDKRLNGIFD